MVTSVSFNPVVTTNAANTFAIQSYGLIQGTAQDDPATRYQLAGGVLASTETLPMWGGVAICESISNQASPATGPAGQLGNVITRATNVSTTGAAGSIVGFSVFDQDWSMINTPQSPVPLAASGMEVNYYRFSSNQRLVVACDPALAAALVAGGIPTTTQTAMWDFVGQELVKSTSFATETISAAVWAATGGGQVTFTVGAVTGITAGAVIDVSGVVSTPAGVFNGAFEVVSAASTSVVVSYPASVSPGTYTSGGTIAASVATVLPINGILEVNIGNSMTVNYNAATGFATWNYSGTAAVIQL